LKSYHTPSQTLACLRTNKQTHYYEPELRELFKYDVRSQRKLIANISLNNAVPFNQTTVLNSVLICREQVITIYEHTEFQSTGCMYECFYHWLIVACNFVWVPVCNCVWFFLASRIVWVVFTLPASYVLQWKTAPLVDYKQSILLKLIVNRKQFYFSEAVAFQNGGQLKQHEDGLCFDSVSLCLYSTCWLLVMYCSFRFIDVRVWWVYMCVCVCLDGHRGDKL